MSTVLEERPQNVHVQASHKRTPRSMLMSKDFAVATISGLLLWLAFPPVGVAWIAWIAPAGLVYLARRETTLSPKPLRWLYTAGFVHWLLMVQWVRLPHWSAFFGWLLLAAYLAVYMPAFVLITRVMIRDWRLPSIVAAPIVWTGLEYARGFLFTGFSLSLLAHSQVDFARLIQIADIFGAYGVSFVMVCVAACIELMVCPFSDFKKSKVAWLQFGVGIVAICATLAYGHFKLGQMPTPPNDKSIKIALVQGAYDTVFDGDLERSHQAFEDYARLSQLAVQRHADIDVVVWPESMFSTRVPLISIDEPVELNDDFTVEDIRQFMQINESDRKIVAGNLQCAMIVGSEREHFYGDQVDRFNAALWLAADGSVTGHYDKRHPVMFGEYVPLGDRLPWLYNLTPMGQGLTAGTSTESFEIKGVRLTPLICFENTVPHLVRNHVRELQGRNADPDALVTITNDGWFWGSSLLDVHLACGVFRAIEMRRPMLIAANTGFSAWINQKGDIQQKGKRRDESVLVDRLDAGRQESSLYLKYGDSAAFLCLIVTLCAAIFGCFQWKLAH